MAFAGRALTLLRRASPQRQFVVSNLSQGVEHFDHVFAHPTFAAERWRLLASVEQLGLKTNLESYRVLDS